MVLATEPSHAGTFAFAFAAVGSFYQSTAGRNVLEQQLGKSLTVNMTTVVLNPRIYDSIGACDVVRTGRRAHTRYTARRCIASLPCAIPPAFPLSCQLRCVGAGKDVPDRRARGALRARAFCTHPRRTPRITNRCCCGGGLVRTAPTPAARSFDEHPPPASLHGPHARQDLSC